MPYAANDANGNTLSDPTGKSYSWDFENRHTQAVVPGTGTVAFKYDPFGRRIQKSGPLGTTNYLYDGLRGGATVIEEVDSSGNVLARYTQGSTVDQPLAELSGSTISYYNQDSLGSITSLSNTAGALANTYNYDSFGKLTASTGTLTNPFQYTGREYDNETSLYFYRARYYDLAAGRFVNEDPLRVRGGINFYAYVGNNAINHTDPTGLKCDNCTSASPLPSNSSACNGYGSETYLGVSLQCFCKCAGDSSWSQQVRGCLACEHASGANPFVAHAVCYAAAGPWNAPYGTLATCYKQCWVGP